MKRFVAPTSVLFLALCFSAFGQTIDPVGFCPPPATVGGCTTANGIGGETIGVGATQIGMFKNGNGGTAVNPWELLVAIPDYTGSAPAITSASFTIDASISPNPVDVGQFLPTSGDLYTFAGTSGDNSMNAANMFGANEVAAFGSTPSYFEVFGYFFNPGISNNTPYLFSVGGTGLPAGTFLAAAGGSNPFTTPFTTTGLVNGPGCTPSTCGGGGSGGPVPEPFSITLLATVCAFVGYGYRKKARLS